MKIPRLIISLRHHALLLTALFAGLRRSTPTLFVLLSAIVLLGACSGEDAAAQGAGSQDAGSQDAAAESDRSASVEGNSQSDPSGYSVWSGERVEFAKEDGADPTLPANQDRLSENVWITRGNNGGQIFNIRQRSSALKPASPVGTEWAQGTTDRIDELDFRPFRAAVGSPKNVTGTDLVLHLIEEDVYLDVRFLSWSAGKRGGFSYERSTPQK